MREYEIAQRAQMLSSKPGYQPLQTADLPLLEAMNQNVEKQVADLSVGTGGVKSNLENGLGPNFIALTGSPQTVTNSGESIEVIYIAKASGTIGQIRLNGNLIFDSDADHTILLQAGESVEIYYTGTPAFLRKYL